MNMDMIVLCFVVPLPWPLSSHCPCVRDGAGLVTGGWREGGVLCGNGVGVVPRTEIGDSSNKQPQTTKNNTPNLWPTGVCVH